MQASSTGYTEWIVPMIGTLPRPSLLTPGDASVTGSRVKVTLILFLSRNNNNYSGAMFNEVPGTFKNY